MPTSTRFAVAVHALATLALRAGAPVRSDDLAVSANTNAVVIRGLLSQLSRAKITTSRLGAGGGALLAKSAAKIRLLDVYNAVEDGDIFSLPRTPPSVECPIGANIQRALCPALERARTALEKELARVTIADIATNVARLGKLPCPGKW